MNTDNTYIKVTDVDDDNFTPSDEQLELDNYADVEYTTPYTDNYDDIMDVGGIIEAGGIFDDR